MAEGADDHDATILLVEDEDDLANMVSINLKVAGYEVERAADGREALAVVDDTDPDLILLDVMMPRLDGWQVLSALKEDPATREIPVIMLTALAEERDIIKGHLQGAVRYVTKPFEVRALLQLIEQALQPPDQDELARRRSTARTLLQRLAELEAGRVADQTVNLSRLESLPRQRTEPEPTEAERSKLDDLTDKQRHIAAELAGGRSARELAEDLDVSRSNVYATRKRIARKLGVPPDDVADEARRLGIGGDIGD